MLMMRFNHIASSGAYAGDKIRPAPELGLTIGMDDMTPGRLDSIGIRR